MVMKICPICGREFVSKKKKQKYCSRECSAKSLKKQKETHCKNCGKTFVIGKYQREFCSHDCYIEYRRSHKDEYSYVGLKRKKQTHETRKCEMCGREFVAYKKTKKRFCSDECRKIYFNSDERKQKREQTMLQRYGKKSVGNGITKERLEEYTKDREEKYQQLCNVSDMELLGYIGKHVLKVKCNKCGYEFETNNLSYIHYNKIVCKNCGEEYKDYKPTIMIMDWLTTIGIEYQKNNRKLIHPYEIDIYLPKYNLAIEVDGNFWHCDKFHDKDYHIMKTKLCSEKGIRLIHIFEDEIVNKFDTVKSYLGRILGLNKEIDSSSCSIERVDIDKIKEFVSLNSLLNGIESCENISLILNKEVVMSILYQQLQEDVLNIVGFATRNGLTVKNGIKILIEKIKSLYNPSIIEISYDVRWYGFGYQDNELYEMGFKKKAILPPFPWYVRKGDMYNRQAALPHGEERNFYRIWDCGSVVLSNESP